MYCNDFNELGSIDRLSYGLPTGSHIHVLHWRKKYIRRQFRSSASHFSKSTDFMTFGLNWHCL